jgi:hypothetical protein
MSTLPIISHSTGTPIQRNTERNIRDSNRERRNQIIPICRLHDLVPESP